MGSPDTPPEGFSERNAARYAQAVEECGPDQMVCGVFGEDGEPMYFLAAKTAPDTDLQDLAFQRRNGRPMYEGERILLAEATTRGLV